MKKSMVVFVLACLVFSFTSAVYAEEVTNAEEVKKTEEGKDGGEGKIGGNLKFWLYDVSEGSSNGTQGVQRSTSGFTSLYIMIDKELSDTVSVEVEPSISASTGATPKLGIAIGSQLASSISPSVSFVRALINVKLPENIELSAGMLHPVFTEDYGLQLWYEETFYGNSVSSNAYYGEMKGNGIELYKSFELKSVPMLGSVSIPAYLYMLDGSNSAYSDNNNSRGVLAHIAPEIGMFKLMGSFFAANWDTDNAKLATRWSGGLGFQYGNFMFRGEYMGGLWKDKEAYVNTSVYDLTKTTIDFKPEGYYLKAAYRITPWMRFLLQYAHYDQNFTKADKKTATTTVATGATSTGTEKVTTKAVTTTSSDIAVGETYSIISPVINFYVLPESIIYAQLDYVINSRLDDLARLEYARFVLGWRTTF